MADKIKRVTSEDSLTGEIERWKYFVPAQLPFNLEVSPPAGAVLVVECSLPRRRWGSNLRLLTADEVVEELQSIYDFFEPYAGWSCPVEGLRVRRLDVGLNFTGTTALPELLRGLVGVHVPRERCNPGLFYSRDLGGALTLVRGSREYERSIVYDKGIEVVHRHRREATALRHPEASAAQHVARFESQARTSYLTRQGITTVADIDDGAIQGLARRAWERHRLGTHVVDPTTVFRVLESDGLSEAVASGIYMTLAKRRVGLTPRFSDETLRTYDRHIARLGLALGDLDGSPT